MPLSSLKAAILAWDFESLSPRERLLTALAYESPQRRMRLYEHAGVQPNHGPPHLRSLFCDGLIEFDKDSFLGSAYLSVSITDKGREYLDDHETPQDRVFSALEDSETNRLSSTLLRERADVTKQIIDGMIEKGLLDWQRDPLDDRTIMLWIKK